jgi:hypothetical protein
MRNFNHLILDLEIKNSVNSSNKWVLSSSSELDLNKSLLIGVNSPNKFTESRDSFNSDFEELNHSNLIYDNNKLSNSAFIRQNTTDQLAAQDVININFLRKERLYTKLKYSRSPAYDIVSGGAAAILAGFIGFLISEKFGFELVDSGDFYYLFMYIVFASFSIRPLLITLNGKDSLKSVFSLKPLINYLSVVVSMLLKRFKI